MTDPTRTPPRRTGMITLSARLAVAAAVVITGALGIGAMVVTPTPTVAQTRPAITATPAAGSMTLGCSGPVFALGRDASNAQALSVANQTDFVTSAPGTAEQESIAVDDVDGHTNTMFSTAPTPEQRAELAAAASTRVTAPDMAGFVAYACQPGSMQSWLVGGDTTVGTTSLVTLTNPGDVTATVDITVFGVSGPVTTPGSIGIVVAAQTTVVVPLAALAGEEISPVLRVDAHQTPIVANLQSSTTRTLVTGGVDVQSSVRTAASTQTIAGAVIAAGDGVQDFQHLRLLATEESTTATVIVRQEGSARDAYTVDVDLQGGIPADVEFPVLPAGRYTVTTTATKNLVAAMWSTTGFGPGSDFAWAVAAPPLREGVTPFVVPAGEAPSLTLANSTADDATVTVVRSGVEETLTVAAHSSLGIALAAQASGEIIVTQGEVSAAISFAGVDAIASFPIWPGDAANRPVAVVR